MSVEYKHHLFLLKAGHVCGDGIDLLDGQPTGSVRVSFGYMSTFEDCQKFLKFVAACFVEKPVTVDQERLKMLQTVAAAPQGAYEDQPIKTRNRKEIERTEPIETALQGFGKSNGDAARTLTNIYIYPIKSCGAFEVITPTCPPFSSLSHPLLSSSLL